MKLRDNKGSITIFVLVGLLFMSAFLLLSYGSNVNKSKTAKEQFNIISSTYSYNDGDENAYMRAYTALRKQNAQEMMSSSENSSTLELTKTFYGPVKNYKIYGNSIQDTETYGTPSPDNPVEVESVGDLVTDETDENYGKYRIPVKVSGKNLWGGQDMVVQSWQYGSKGEIDSSNDVIVQANGTYSRYIVCFKNPMPGKSFIISTHYNNPNGNLISFLVTSSSVITASGERMVQLRSSEEQGVFSTSINTTNEYIQVYFYAHDTGDSDTTSVVTYSKIQIEKGTIATEYEPYQRQTFNIYLDQPLRKVGDVADYVDFSTGKVVRNVEIIDDTGTLTLEESLNSLTTPTEETVELPELTAAEDYTNIEVLTDIAPSKIEVTYDGYTME